MRSIAKYLAIVMLLLVCGEASAQKMKERGCVREGNDYFSEKNFQKSIECYQEALKHDPNSFEAKFDLGSALYCSERYEEAENTLRQLLDDKSLSDVARGEVAYNLGNTQFKQEKYEEALSSYRTAMRCNPNDEDAKHNYAYTKRLLQQQEQQQQDNQDKNKDQNQDQQDQNKDQQGQDKNQDKNQNQDQQNDQNKDNKEDKEESDKGKNNDDKQDNKQNNSNDKEQQNDKGQKNQQPQSQNGKNDQQPQNQETNNAPQQGDKRPEGGLSPEQEAMLQAIQAEEDKTQDKLKKEKTGVLIFKGKNW